MARPAGFEPATPGLGILCSILLSYGRGIAPYSKNAPQPYSLGAMILACAGSMTRRRMRTWFGKRGVSRLIDLLAGHAAVRGAPLLKACLGALVMALAAPSLAEDGIEALVWSEPVPVVEVIAGDELALGDGRRVRLAGLRVPSGGRDPGGGKSVDDHARALLGELIEGAAVRLGTTAAPYDRYGRLVAQIERPDGLWLQGALLERGLAQAWPRPGETARAKEMLALEQAARAARRGLWAQLRFAPRSVERLRDEVGSFQIVRGRVHGVSPSGSFVYLNFGRDWWSDFTLRVDRELADAFAHSGQALPSLAGRRVEARGFLLEAGGPLIELSHPEQIQLLP
jgi:micrococcal nuclease